MKALSAALIPLLLAASSRAAPAPSSETWFPFEQVQGLMDGVKTFPRPGFGRPPAAIRCSVPAMEPDADIEPGCGPSFACGVFGSHCAGKRPTPKSMAQAQEISPINLGFKALGPEGSGGKIDGPGRQGNGTFKVLKNDPYEMSMEVKTGYIDGIVTLKRDSAAGKDAMRYQGRLWKDGEWGPVEDKATEIEVRYDARKDEGSINWIENGEEKSERFWRGGKGGKVMTIEFSGGWNHDFHRD
ncbi:MAG: hypothetical protein HY748_15820 [Elusimicrobia bacterium]|nr:hypothetical protein [Elusimicrobiota bacterium]